MNKFTLILSSILILNNTCLQAQNWVNGGNSLSANGSIGINTNFSLLFKTNNTERGRITNTGLWGIGTGTTIIPNAKMHINSATGQDPFRVQINGVTKFYVHKSGGIAAGVAVAPPANGLLVGGSVGIGTTAPNSRVHINSITNEDPLRVMYNGATKLLVNRNGGVSIGASVTPPPNGLRVQTQLVVNNGGIYVTDTAEFGIGVYAHANGVNGTALRGQGRITGVIGSGDYEGIYGTSEGTGVYGVGDIYGIEGYGSSVGIRGTSANGYGVRGTSDNSYGGYFTSQNGYALYVKAFNGFYAAEFYGNTYTSGTNYSSSDKNIKKNIEDVGNAMSIINRLKPKYYQFRDDGKYASLKLPSGHHFGLLAQDVEEVLPELVKESAHEINDAKPIIAVRPPGKSSITERESTLPKEIINIKAVNYTELLPIVIKGMQEQQQTIQQLQEENINLKERLTKLEAALGTRSNNYNGDFTAAALQQNYPNPFKGTTTLNYSIPKGASGKILVYDTSGKLVKTLAVSDAGQIQLDSTGLSAGTYVYNLIVNGELIGSKQMVLIR